MVGVVGLNYWGPNLVRNFDDLAELTWLCDVDEGHLASVAGRYPHASASTAYTDLLSDDTVDAVVIATPVTRSTWRRVSLFPQCSARRQERAQLRVPGLGSLARPYRRPRQCVEAHD